MSVIELLEKNTETILKEAADSVSRSRLEHYEKAGKKQVEERLRVLFQLAIRSMREKKLSFVNEYVGPLAPERFASGYDLREVQTVINVLEETIWKMVVKEIDPSELAGALGLVSTVLGSAKDILGQTYVSLASKTKVASLDLKKLFS